MGRTGKGREVTGGREGRKGRARAKALSVLGYSMS